MYYSSLDIHNAEKRQILLNIHHPYPQPWSGAKRERETNKTLSILWIFRYTSLGNKNLKLTKVIPAEKEDSDIGYYKSL